MGLFACQGVGIAARLERGRVLEIKEKLIFQDNGRRERIRGLRERVGCEGHVVLGHRGDFVVVSRKILKIGNNQRADQSDEGQSLEVGDLRIGAEQ